MGFFVDHLYFLIRTAEFPNTPSLPLPTLGLNTPLPVLVPGEPSAPQEPLKDIHTATLVRPVRSLNKLSFKDVQSLHFFSLRR